MPVSSACSTQSAQAIPTQMRFNAKCHSSTSHEPAIYHILPSKLGMSDQEEPMNANSASVLQSCQIAGVGLNKTQVIAGRSE